MQNIIKKSNFVILPSDTDSNQQKYDAWQKLRDSGMTISQVAELFSVSEKTIRSHTETRYDWRVNSGQRNAKLTRMEYYVPLMLELRKRGYSNVDIGKKTGFCSKTVRSYVGTQPDETTLASHRAAGAKRRFRNIAVKNQPERDAGKPIPAVAAVLETA